MSRSLDRLLMFIMTGVCFVYVVSASREVAFECGDERPKQAGAERFMRRRVGKIMSALWSRQDYLGSAIFIIIIACIFQRTAHKAHTQLTTPDSHPH